MADHSFVQAIIGQRREEADLPRQAVEGHYSSVADAVPEGVDFSEGGWATDFAASITGFLFLSSGWYFYGSDPDNAHWLWMYAGTCLAHLFGGLAHRYYPNRASDGVGQPGFYVTMILGYSGNCLRYGFGWDLGVVWSVIAVVNIVYMAGTGVWVIRTMQRTSERVDTVEQGTVLFDSDRWFAMGEAFCSAMEVLSCLVYAVTAYLNVNETFTGFALLAVVANLTGWISVYVFGLLYAVKGREYNPNLMQRIFHYSMIIMLWGLDANVRYEQQQSQN
ncbi:hypothetical protein ACA910_006537 [Epithemia clementina (nom. ined.)]